MSQLTITYATTTTRQFQCPHCDDGQWFRFDHLKVDVEKEVGPWCCHACGTQFKVTRINEDEVSLLKLEKKGQIRSLSLLKLFQPLSTGEQVFLAVASLGLDAEHKEYYYNEGTCPWNYLRTPVLHGDDSDPHGVFQWVETVPWPGPEVEGFTDHGNDFNIDNLATWLELFPSLRDNSKELVINPASNFMLAPSWGAHAEEAEIMASILPRVQKAKHTLSVLMSQLTREIADREIGVPLTQVYALLNSVKKLYNEASHFIDEQYNDIGAAVAVIDREDAGDRYRVENLVLEAVKETTEHAVKCGSIQAQVAAVLGDMPK